MPTTGRQVQLAARPDGLPRPEHFTVARVPVPDPGPGQALVRNLFFQVFPSVRTLINGGVQGAPFPELQPGDTLPGAAVGEVLSASEGSDLRPGDLVSHWQGWREYAVVDAAACTALGDALPDPAAHLGQGHTAYTALTAADTRPGDTVLVTGAAGAVGSMAGQIARLLGAARVIGSTGSRTKAERLVNELGYDAVVLRDELIDEQLAKAAPDGIDVLVDNVGGEQLRAAVRAARTGARFALVGTLSSQLSPSSSGTTGPVELDTFQLILKQITLRGVTGAATTREEWAERFGEWLRAGRLTFPHVRVAGIDNAPQALHELISGRHLGAVIVEV
ncbi:NADP-dependent oxidoreductase [Actinomadura barringtoniae]|uniref:NADP-dependent oxidoreductase n=1 Tax=Actinomadura barringtoniae TaxID=1427535 RepID=A0A939PKP6_9ACTN|nr:NADP-dependent oxidoreductase [Actinomadura barringtoniae]MBO2454100.1 NADP-dependent oxidoreductase [Actinomadura barringtoniae]